MGYTEAEVVRPFRGSVKLSYERVDVNYACKTADIRECYSEAISAFFGEEPL